MAGEGSRSVSHSWDTHLQSLIFSGIMAIAETIASLN